MKTKIIALVTVLVSLLQLTACAQQQAGKRYFEIPNTETISIDIACQLILVQGNKPNIEILGEEDLLNEIETKISNGKVTLRSDRDWKFRDKVVVKVEVDNLRRLNIGGAVDMKTVETLQLANLKMSVSGVGNIEMSLKSENFELTCSGVCNMDITGGTENLNIKVSGVGNIDATEFKSINADVSNSGVGKINVLVVEELDATVSGIGSIRYAGNPSVRANISGLGSVKKY